MLPLLPAHLLDSGAHLADLLFYGLPGLGLAAGIALFVCGRAGRRHGPPPDAARTEKRTGLDHVRTPTQDRQG